MKEMVVKETDSGKPKYVTPRVESHEPVKIVQGTGDCSSLYYVALYTLYE